MFQRKTSIRQQQAELDNQLEAKLKELREAKKVVQVANAQNTRERMWGAVKWGFKGFGNIAKSLNSPNDSRRMKIAQMPARRRDMDIVRNANQSMLKHPALRGRTIQGKKIK